jgi:hypothetical protein
MLKSTVNNKATQKKVKTAANKFFGHRKARPVFEHGHWWVTWYDENKDGQRSFDVVDAEGPGSVNGFGFEEV